MFNFKAQLRHTCDKDRKSARVLDKVANQKGSQHVHCSIGY